MIRGSLLFSIHFYPYKKCLIKLSNNFPFIRIHHTSLKKRGDSGEKKKSGGGKITTRGKALHKVGGKKGRGVALGVIFFFSLVLFHA